MNSKLNEEAIRNYSQAYSNKILDEYFNRNPKISGEAILSISDVKQVNLFILKILFESWQAELDNLKSSYFDYEHTEVKNALQSFQNTLSRHILIDRDNFEPLFQEAVYDSILIILSPYRYYYAELEKTANVQKKRLQGSKKFTKVNQSILLSLIAEFKTQHIQECSSDQAIEILNKILEGTTSSPDDITNHVEAFNNILPLDLDRIYIDGDEFVEKPQKEKAASGIDIVGDNEDLSSEKSNVVALNDAFSTTGQTTLADLHEKQKIDRIETNITLNQRFMFVNELFDGDVKKFNDTIQKLDNLANSREAQKYISAHFSHWDPSDDEAKEFFDIVARRFV